MIVRIMGEGQYELKGSALAELDEMDDVLLSAVKKGAPKGFDEALESVLSLVRSRGVRKADSFLGESDLILPAPDMSLQEAQELFEEYPADLVPEAPADS
jgi:hypothetical protein